MQSALQCHRAYQARSQLALLKITPSSSRSEASSPTVRLRRCRLRRTPDRCPQNDVSCVSSVPSSTVLGQTFEVSMRECLCVSVVYVFQCAVHRNRISTSDIAFCDTTTTATPLGLQRLRCQCCRVGSVVQCCSSDCKKKLVGIRTELGYIHIYIYTPWPTLPSYMISCFRLFVSKSCSRGTDMGIYLPCIQQKQRVYVYGLFLSRK